MITKFGTVYAGHVDLPDMGQDATPANERRYSNEHLATVFEKTDAIARRMDELGYHVIWLAEHHFQHEGYEVLPNLLLSAVHLGHVTRRIKIGCGFNITPMWHPLRLAEDYAVADILTGGRVIFGVGRGYHTREVETFGAPMRDAEANRALFEEQVEIVLRAFREERFSHRGKHYTLPPAVPYRGYELRDITLVPRPLHQPVECWQPIVSASPRGLDFMVRHGIKGVIGGGAATMAEGPIHGYQAAAARAGRDLALGEDLCLGIFFHLAETREQALREMRPFYEEHVKMFAPLGFVPGITPAQAEAAARRGGWDAAGVPRLEDYVKTGAWFAGPPEELVAWLQNLQDRFPALEYVNVSSSMGTPAAVMLEQLRWFAREVMPAFTAGAGAPGAAGREA
jgi:alkanesulfonate monooxygenase SsuD/methylene tetrahydromethanopterin reductase-like flavin-dependent oxidoreductase (luciferase family)